MIDIRLRQCWHIARADILTRVRQRRLFVIAIACLYLGHIITVGDLQLLFNDQHLEVRYQGVHNAPWIGTVMAVVTAGIIGLFGFYLVNDSVSHDQRSGPNKLLASSTISNTTYLFGKWVGNLVTLLIFIGFIAVAVVILFLFRGVGKMDLLALLAPFLLLTVPTASLVAAIAVLFDTIDLLRGTLGNVVYFFGVVFIGLQSMVNIDPVSLGIVFDSIQSSIHAQYPQYTEHSFAFSSASPGEKKSFTWDGFSLTAQLTTNWLKYTLISVMLAGSPSLFFNRFDPAAGSYNLPSVSFNLDLNRPTVDRSGSNTPDLGSKRGQGNSTLSRIQSTNVSFNLHRLIIAEMKLALRGRSWSWYVGTLALILIGVASGGAEYVLIIAWIWPLFIWSHLGVREQRYHTQPIIFTSRYPIVQIGAAWLAVAFITLAILSGPLVGQLLSGAPGLGIIAGVIFVPSLALLSGVVSNAPRLFEIAYLVLWYIGIVNQEAALDFGGVSEAPTTVSIMFIGIGIVLLGITLVHRSWMTNHPYVMKLVG